MGEMNSEIEKRTNCENGRRPSFISSVLSDWFNQPLARSLIGWNLRRCSWLKLFSGAVENNVKSVFCDYFPMYEVLNLPPGEVKRFSIDGHSETKSTSFACLLLMIAQNL